jgi:hypothetical protein
MFMYDTCAQYWWHTNTDFEQFTSDEVDQLPKPHPDLKWSYLRADDLTAMHNCVNTWLLEEQIPEASNNLFEWRAARAI